MEFPKPIEDLIYELSRLPGIGRKSAQRMAFYILTMEDAKVDNLIQALGEAQRSIHPCKRCNSLTDGELCKICRDDGRDRTKLCVVEDTREMLSIEETGKFNGYYFVLGTLISPMRHIGPEDIHISQLEALVEREPIQEIIVAVSPTVEGESTALFIANVMKDKPIQVTQLAQGIALGSSLEYYDVFTLSKALDERKRIK